MTKGRYPEILEPETTMRMISEDTLQASTVSVDRAVIDGSMRNAFTDGLRLVDNTATAQKVVT